MQVIRSNTLLSIGKNHNTFENSPFQDNSKVLAICMPTPQNTEILHILFIVNTKGVHFYEASVEPFKIWLNVFPNITR